MPGRALLDTNIVIALIAEEAAVCQALAAAEEVFVPSIVLGELYYGARKSGHPEANLAKIEEFAGANSILACDAATARHYGLIKAILRRKGRPIPENDIWIASLAQQFELTLITRDEHFDEVEKLSVEKW